MIAYDKGHAQIDRQVEQRKEHLRSDAPDARQFRAQAWAQAERQYVAERSSWAQAISQANAHLESASGQTARPNHNPQGESQMDRSKQQQNQQQAQQKQAQEKAIAERQAREAQARQLAEKQQKQKEQKQKDREQARMMNQSMDIDR